MIGDYVLPVSAGVITAALVILAAFLPKYRKAVREGANSGRLAEDIWGAVNTRLAVMDARVIELMAKVDVYRVKSDKGFMPSILSGDLEGNAVESITEAEDPAPAHIEPAAVVGLDTQKQILVLLSDGAKTSSQIRQVIGKSREHTARLMKDLFDRGLVLRNDAGKPFRYQLSENGKGYLSGT